MKLKKVFSLLLVVSMTTVILSACGVSSKSESTSSAVDSTKSKTKEITASDSAITSPKE